MPPVPDPGGRRIPLHRVPELMILVVGATGHLGTTICRRLGAAGYPVCALVRPGSDYRHLTTLGVPTLEGDLRRADSVREAVAGADAVVATANAVFPSSRRDDFDTVEGDGYFNLIRACQRNPVERLVFVSLPVTPWDDLVPSYRFKRQNESRIQRSGVPFTILRAAPFMDDWLAFMGTTVPLRGNGPHALRRRCWFSRLYVALTGHLMQWPGVALVPGTGWARHAFVTVEDVAGFSIDALFSREAEDRIVNVGGPEILTWNEAVDACARAFGCTLRRIPVPSGLYRAQQMALARISPPLANLLGRFWIQSQWDTPYETGEVRPLRADRPRTTVEQFLRWKSALAPA